MIETAIYSWWSLPKGIPSESQSKVAEFSIRLAKMHFKKVVFYTDDKGAEWAKDLPFDEIHRTLNQIPEGYKNVWALGKLYATLQQKAPFVHLDFDSFLWEKLPHSLATAPILAERVELIDPGCVEKVLAFCSYIPKYWKDTFRSVPWQYNCGIFGGNDVNLLLTWAKDGIAVVHGANGFKDLPTWGPSGVVEQFGLAAIFPSATVLFDEHVDRAWKVMYTHCMGQKDDPGTLARIKYRLSNNKFAPVC